MKIRFLAPLFVLAFSAFATPKSDAAVFAKFDGIVASNPDNPVGREDWTEILDFSFGVEREFRGGAPTATKRALPGVSIKLLDGVSPLLARALDLRTVIPKMTIEIDRPDGAGGTTDYFRYEFTNVVVASWKVEEGSGGAEADPFSFNFEEIKWVFQSIKVTHLPSGNTYTIGL